MAENKYFEEFQKSTNLFYFVDNFLINDIVKKIAMIEENKISSRTKVNSLDTLFNYLWWNSFKTFIKNAYKFKIDDEIKEHLYSISKSIQLCNDSFVSFVNEHYAEIFSEGYLNEHLWIVVFYNTIGLCYNEFEKEIDKRVFSFLENNHPLRLLGHFDICSTYYSFNRKEFESLFCNLEQTNLFDDNIYLNVLRKLNKKSDPFLVSKADFICKRTLKSINEMNLTEDSKDILQITGLFGDYEKLAIQYKLMCRNDYSNLKKKLISTLDKYIRKHGEHYKIGPYNFQESVDFFEKNSDPERFINLTHRYDNGTYSNNLDYILDVKNRNNLSELFNDISRNRSEKYPYFKQDSMQTDMWAKSNILNLLLLKKDITKDLFNYIYNVAIHIQKRYFEDKIDIEHETTGELDNVLSIVQMANDGNYESDQSKILIKSISMSICCTIEKIVRNIVIKENKDKTYIDPDELTLGNCFKSKYKMLSISEGLKYHLEYFLLKEVNAQKPLIDRPGKNIRNILMHGLDEIDDKILYGNLMNLLYLLISLMNDLYICSNKYEN